MTRSDREAHVAAGAAREPHVAAGAAREPHVAAGAAREPHVAAGAAREPHVAAGAAPTPAPNPHATAVEVEAARHDTKLAQVLYHDWGSRVLRRQVVDLLRPALHRLRPGPFRRDRAG